MDFRQKYSSFFSQLDEEYMEEDRFVPATGPEDPDYMIVGEAPGANEVEQGEPFVGRAGRRMNQVLSDIGVERSDLYITNLVKVRPPDNRDPRRDEIEAWRPLLEMEIEEIDPVVILTLGNFASRELLDTDRGITSIHGRKFTVDGREIMPIYHPAATLYDRSKTPELEQDMRKAFGREGSGQQTLEDL